MIMDVKCHYNLENVVILDDTGLIYKFNTQFERLKTRCTGCKRFLLARADRHKPNFHRNGVQPFVGGRPHK